MALILLLLLFIGVPSLEIAVFIKVGGLIGVWPTVMLTLLTALAGSLMLRTQGWTTLMRARALLDRGQLPAREIFDGICLVLAGALLLVPGFVTDVIGLLLFFPPFRDLLRLLIARYTAAKAARGEAQIFVDGVDINPDGRGGRGPRGRGSQGRGSQGRGPQGRGGRGTVIDGDYEDVTGHDDADDDDSGAPPHRRLGR